MRKKDKKIEERIDMARKSEHLFADSRTGRFKNTEQVTRARTRLRGYIPHDTRTRKVIREKIEAL